jgi:hypothetical protein
VEEEEPPPTPDWPIRPTARHVFALVKAYTDLSSIAGSAGERRACAAAASDFAEELFRMGVAAANAASATRILVSHRGGAGRRLDAPSLLRSLVQRGPLASPTGAGGFVRYVSALATASGLPRPALRGGGDGVKALALPGSAFPGAAGSLTERGCLPPASTGAGLVVELLPSRARRRATAFSGKVLAGMGAGGSGSGSDRQPTRAESKQAAVAAAEAASDWESDRFAHAWGGSQAGAAAVLVVGGVSATSVGVSYSLLCEELRALDAGCRLERRRDQAGAGGGGGDDTGAGAGGSGDGADDDADAAEQRPQPHLAELAPTRAGLGWPSVVSQTLLRLTSSLEELGLAAQCAAPVALSMLVSDAASPAVSTSLRVLCRLRAASWLSRCGLSAQGETLRLSLGAIPLLRAPEMAAFSYAVEEKETQAANRERAEAAAATAAGAGAGAGGGSSSASTASGSVSSGLSDEVLLSRAGLPGVEALAADGSRGATTAAGATRTRSAAAGGGVIGGVMRRVDAGRTNSGGDVYVAWLGVASSLLDEGLPDAAAPYIDAANRHATALSDAPSLARAAVLRTRCHLVEGRTLAALREASSAADLARGVASASEWWEIASLAATALVSESRVSDASAVVRAAAIALEIAVRPITLLSAPDGDEEAGPTRPDAALSRLGPCQLLSGLLSTTASPNPPNYTLGSAAVAAASGGHENAAAAATAAALRGTLRQETELAARAEAEASLDEIHGVAHRDHEGASGSAAHAASTAASGAQAAASPMVGAAEAVAREVELHGPCADADWHGSAAASSAWR